MLAAVLIHCGRHLMVLLRIGTRLWPGLTRLQLAGWSIETLVRLALQSTGGFWTDAAFIKHSFGAADGRYLPLDEACSRPVEALQHECPCRQPRQMEDVEHVEMEKSQSGSSVAPDEGIYSLKGMSTVGKVRAAHGG